MNRIHKPLGRFFVLICANLLIDSDFSTNNCFATDFAPSSKSEYVIEEYSDGDKMVSDIKKYTTSHKKSEGTLVFWDCDDVLQMSSDNDFRGYNLREILKKLPPAIFPKVIWGSHKTVVEKCIQDCTNYLCESGVNQFVFTQCSSDDRTRHNRKGVLKNLGYSFFNNAKKLEGNKFNFSEEDIKLRFGQTQTTEPVYEDGIIYTGSVSKGKTITEFFKILEKANIKNFNVIFIDDKLENINEVYDACYKFGIPKFYGFHYTFVQQNTKKIPQYKVDLYKEFFKQENELYLRKVIKILDNGKKLIC